MLLTEYQERRARAAWRRLRWRDGTCPLTGAPVLEPAASARVAMPDPGPDPASCKAGAVLNTGPFPADGTLRQYRWEPDRPVRLQSLRYWWGVQLGGKCDLHAEAFDLGTGCSLMPGNGDHYADGPHGAMGFVYEYRPYVYLWQDSGLVINVVANGWGARPLAHLMINATWTYPPP